MRYFEEGVQLDPDEVKTSTIEEYTDDGFVPRKDMLGTGKLIGQRIDFMEADLEELQGIDAVQNTCLEKMGTRIDRAAAIRGKLIDIGCGDVSVTDGATVFLSRCQEDR
jgi:hypothetical protein